MCCQLDVNSAGVKQETEGLGGINVPIRSMSVTAHTRNMIGVNIYNSLSIKLVSHSAELVAEGLCVPD